MFGVGREGESIQPPDMGRYFRLKKCEVVAVRLEARKLKTDFWLISGMSDRFSGFQAVVASCANSSGV